MGRTAILLALSAVAASIALAAFSATSTAGVAGGASPHWHRQHVRSAPRRATLGRVMLRRSDVPRSFAAKPYQGSGGAHSRRDQRVMAHCLGIRTTHPDHVASAHSADYPDGTTQLSSSVDSYRRRGDVADDSALVRSPKAVRCLRSDFRRELAGDLPAGASVRNLRLRVSRASGGQPHDVLGAVTGSLVVTGSGHSIPMYLVMTLIAGPYVEAEITGVGIGHRVPIALERRLAAKVARRAARV